MVSPPSRHRRPSVSLSLFPSPSVVDAVFKTWPFPLFISAAKEPTNERTNALRRRHPPTKGEGESAFWERVGGLNLWLFAGVKEGGGGLEVVTLSDRFPSLGRRLFNVFFLDPRSRQKKSPSPLFSGQCQKR